MRVLLYFYRTCIDATDIFGLPTEEIVAAQNKHL